MTNEKITQAVNLAQAHGGYSTPPTSATDANTSDEVLRSALSRSTTLVGKGVQQGEKMRISFEPHHKAMWHTDCANHLGGVMEVVQHEDGRSLLKCLHCGKQGYYPNGSVGEVCVDVVEAATGQAGEHITSKDCWCEPEVDYKDPDTGATVYVHRNQQ